MNVAVRPPRLARWILARVVPPDVRVEILGNVEEMFDRRARSGGPLGPARRGLRIQPTEALRAE